MKILKKLQPYIERFGLILIPCTLVIVLQIFEMMFIKFDPSNITVIIWICIALFYKWQADFIKFDFTNPLVPAMKVLYKHEADAYLSQYINFIHTTDIIPKKLSLTEARRIALDNIGYYSGYFDYETGERMERLFGAVHPVLGTVEQRKKLTSKEIIEMGKNYAKINLKP